MVFKSITLALWALSIAHVHSLGPLISRRQATLPSTSNPICDASSLGAEATCFEKGTEILRTANTKDCLRAILKLPESPEQGNFHTGEPFDLWTLPIIKPHESCRVTVTMNDDRMHELATWDRVVQTASTLISLCSHGQFPLGRSGGQVSMGSGGLLKIVVEKASAGEGEGGFEIGNMTAGVLQTA